MWFFPTKKEIKAEFRKIGLAFKARDKDIKAELHNINSKIITQDQISLMIENTLLKSGSMSELNTEPNLKPNLTNYDKVIIRRGKKSRPEGLKTAIRGYLNEGMRTTDIYNIIVKEKGLISKTQFYHYLSLVRNEVRSKVRTKPHI